MLKKLLISTLAFASVLLINMSARAADVNTSILIQDYDFPNIQFYPQVIHVNTGDVIHLTVKNSRRFETRIFIPSYNLSQLIPKDNLAKFDLSVDNPTSRNIWFEISIPDGKKIPGYIIVDNYQVPMSTICSKPVDTSGLDKIINYSTDFSYPAKPEPVYAPHPHPTGKAAPVKGYW